MLEGRYDSWCCNESLRYEFSRTLFVSGLLGIIRMSLPKRRLGNSDMEITPVGIGTAPIGSNRDWAIYWGETDERTAINAIRAALDNGVNWIDTAPFYGWGRAERIVGEALKGRREGVLIFTKCGTIRTARRPDGSDFGDDLRPASIRKEVEESLARLQTDHVDLYQMHDPDPKVPIEDSWGEIFRLIDQGKVRHAGLSNHPIELIERAEKVGPVTSLQAEYSPLFRETENFFPFLLRNNIGLLSWGSLAEGFLADGFDLERLSHDDFRRTRHRFGRPENYEKIKMVRTRLLEMAVGRGISLVDLVVSWELSHKELTGAIIGVKNQSESEQMVKAATTKLSSTDIADFDEALSGWNAS